MILISPYSSRLRNGNRNAKNYPWWPELLATLGPGVVQIGVAGEEVLATDHRFGLPLALIRGLVQECDYWISVDNFLPHLAHQEKKPGVVLWSKSDPNIFGYPDNLNLIHDLRFMRENQFGSWEGEPYDPEAFMPAGEVCETVGFWRELALAEVP
jgi:hypothetical protein